ncbi:hypothetical protein OQA88_9952 [Cercophora sp. LCS_1]
MATTMKSALIHPGTSVSLSTIPIPSLPTESHILIRVIASGSNPKDWKLPDLRPSPPLNQGDDIAGIVEKVGSLVYEFKPGDRVAAFHEMLTPGGSYAEYALAWDHTTFHLPHDVSFEEGAALPLASMTAALGLFQKLGLPGVVEGPGTEGGKNDEGRRKLPLIIYGAASAVGFYALQWAQRAGIHPLICVAGRAKEYVEGFLDRDEGDVVVDYRQDRGEIVRQLKEAAAGGGGVRYALDAVAEKGSPEILSEVLQDGGHVTFVLRGRKEVREEVEQSTTMVGSVHRDAKDFGFAYFRLMARGLREGWFRPQRVEVREGGLNGVEGALKDLKAGKASGVKYVFRIEETEGL